MWIKFSNKLYNPATGELIDVKLKLTGIAAEVVKSGKRHESEKIKMFKGRTESS